MIALLQRVTEARVTVGERVAGEIGPGLVCFVCAEPEDDDALADRLVAKILALRIFADEARRPRHPSRRGVSTSARSTPRAGCTRRSRPANSAPTCA